LLTLRNILHGSVVDTSRLGNDTLLCTTVWIVDVAMSNVLPRSRAVLGEMARTTTIEADVAGGDSSGRWRR
jgi:hypothetical protein